MTKATQALIIVVTIILVAGGIWWFATRQTADEAPRDQQTGQQPPENDTIEPQPDPDAVMPALTVTYTNNGFNIPDGSIRVGEPIQVTNQADGNLDLASDPHPQHTDNPELNIGIISPGQDSVFAISQAGTWNFHNHLHPAHTGSITVTD